MSSVNKVILIGNLGRDPEVRYTPNGAAVCNLGIATTRAWKDKTSGEKQEETEWHRVVLFDRLAEVAGEYLKKGRPVYIEGRLRTRKWTDKDGVERYTTEIYAESLVMLGGRDDGGGRRDDEGGGQQRQQQPQRTQGQQRSAPPQRQASQQRQQQSRGSTGFDDMDDDIPF